MTSDDIRDLMNNAYYAIQDARGYLDELDSDLGTQFSNIPEGKRNGDYYESLSARLDAVMEALSYADSASSMLEDAQDYSDSMDVQEGDWEVSQS